MAALVGVCGGAFLVQLGTAQTGCDGCRGLLCNTDWGPHGAYLPEKSHAVTVFCGIRDCASVSPSVFHARPWKGSESPRVFLRQVGRPGTGPLVGPAVHWVWPGP